MLSVFYESREVSQGALNAEQWHSSGVTKGKGAPGKTQVKLSRAQSFSEHVG